MEMKGAKTLVKVLIALFLLIAIVVLTLENQKNKKIHEKFSSSIREGALEQVGAVVEMKAYIVQSSIIGEGPYFCNAGFSILNRDTIFFGHFRQGNGIIKRMTIKEVKGVFQLNDVENVGSDP